jgi:hypothetical protein
MAFGQQSGPPASSEQVRELLALLNDAGHTDFRDARGPMGFTQRQAAGKFTRDEAAAFIARLQGNEPEGTSLAVAPAAKLSAQEQLLRLGWSCRPLTATHRLGCGLHGDGQHGAARVGVTSGSLCHPAGPPDLGLHAGACLRR